MGRRRSELPADLPAVLTVADAIARGIPRGRLYGDDLGRPHHGVRVIAGAGAADVSDGEAPLTERAAHWRRMREEHIRRLREYLPVLPAAGYFCGPSAAMVWGIPLPPRNWEAIHVGMPRPARTARRPGVIGHQHTAGFVTVVRKDGMPLTDPASTWATLGGILAEDDLVVAADRVLHIPRMPGGFRRLDESALASREELQLLTDRKGRPGAPRLRRALEHARTGAASPPESRIRLLIRDHGLPEPVLDHDVRDGFGRFLGCSELAYPDRKLAIEYESDGHLTQAQLQRDIDKYHAYAEAGWDTVRLTSEHVFRSPREAIRRIRRALEASFPR